MISFTLRTFSILQLFFLDLRVIMELVGFASWWTSFLDSMCLGTSGIWSLGRSLLGLLGSQCPRGVVVNQVALGLEELGQRFPELCSSDSVVIGFLLGLLLPFNSKILLVLGRHDLDGVADGVQVIGHLLLLLHRLEL